MFHLNSNIGKLFLLMLLAFLFRFYLLPQNLFFGPEQGRDLLAVKDIVYERDLTLIGPKTDIDGVFHGPFYYYLAALPFALSEGNPLAVSAFLILLHSLGGIFLYLLGNELFNRRIGLIALVLFTVSFGAVMYARWLSHPALSLPFSMLFFWLLQRYLRKNRRGYLWGAAIIFGLLVQVEILNAVFIGLALLFIGLLYRNKIAAEKKPYLLLFLSLAAAISFGWLILFDLRHNFLIARQILQLLRGEVGYHFAFTAGLNLALNSSLKLYTKTVVPRLPVLGAAGLLTVTALLMRALRSGQRHAGLVLAWLTAPVLSLIILRHETLEHFLTVSLGAMLITAALLIEKIRRRFRWLGIGVLGAVVVWNLFVWGENLPKNRGMTFQAAQPGLRYEDQLKAIDQIYQLAAGRRFEVQTYTIPYWYQDGWEYLFWYYGQKKYGYLPVAEKAPLLFVIVQDDPSNELFQENWLNNTVASWGNEQVSFRSGILEVKQLTKSPL